MNEDPIPHTPDKVTPVKVIREVGRCDYCDSVGGQVIGSYDPRVYTGKACPDCVLGGRASDRYRPDHSAMRPMVFVARALRGDEPFKTLLRAADLQKADPEGAERLRKKATRGRPLVMVAPNRKMKRAAVARARSKA